MFDKKQQDQHLAQNRILKLQRFRPVFTRIPNIIDGKVSGMSKEERIALQIDELLAKEVIVEIPPSLPTVNDVDAVRSWESTLRGDNMPLLKQSSDVVMASSKKIPHKLEELRRHPNISHQDCLQLLTILTSLAPCVLSPSPQATLKVKKREHDPLALNSSPVRGASSTSSPSPVSPEHWPKSPSPTNEPSSPLLTLRKSQSKGSPSTPNRDVSHASQSSFSQPGSSSPPSLNRRVSPPPSVPKKRKSDLLDEIVLVPPSDASMSFKGSQSQSQPFNQVLDKDVLPASSSPPQPLRTARKPSLEKQKKLGLSRSPTQALAKQDDCCEPTEKKPGEHIPCAWRDPSFITRSKRGVKLAPGVDETQATKPSRKTLAPRKEAITAPSAVARGEPQVDEEPSKASIKKPRTSPSEAHLDSKTESEFKRKRDSLQGDENAPASKKRTILEASYSDEEISDILRISRQNSFKGKDKATAEHLLHPHLVQLPKSDVDISNIQKSRQVADERKVYGKAERANSRKTKGRNCPNALPDNPNPVYTLPWSDLGDMLLRRAIEKYKPNTSRSIATVRQ
jgi:hypothetical protein